jgi:hypothetical protein
LRVRYREMAKTLGFEGHMNWAEAMAMTAVGPEGSLRIGINDIRKSDSKLCVGITVNAPGSGEGRMMALLPPRSRAPCTRLTVNM